MAFYFIFNLANQPLKAQQKATYWVVFTDKANSKYSLSRPLEFLSQNAINRRLKNDIKLSTNDLPVNQLYTDSLIKTGVRVMYTSKWFNAATIEVSDENIIETIKSFKFVNSIEKTRDAENLKQARYSSKNDIVYDSVSTYYKPNEYGAGLIQIDINKGRGLHDRGFFGKGITIALLDAGFRKADEFASLSHAYHNKQIIETRDFVKPGNNVYKEHQHGAVVLSTIASQSKNVFIGTAPEASFLLLRTEDAASEYPVEGDNWIAGAELADSAGADIISTSLGYNEYDNPVYSLSYANINGETARVSKAATIASSKGIVVLASAGNDGDKTWHYIGAPADAKDILAVGALNSRSQKAAFSSFGPSADGRVKPEVMAMGEAAKAEATPGVYTSISGTSFSCPITAGLVACLIQAFPKATASQIRQAVIQSASQYSKPDSVMGYGIANFEIAYQILQYAFEKNKLNSKIFPNPFTSDVSLLFSRPFNQIYKVECFNTSGQKAFSFQNQTGYVLLTKYFSALPQGLYIIRISSSGESTSVKAIKVNTKD